jgi:transcriptional regulator with XRE-family HTH domain
MKTSAEWLDALQTRYGWETDYVTARNLGTSRSNVSHWRTGYSSMDDETALKIAALLSIPEGYILACVQAERQGTKRPAVRDAWERVARQLGRGVAAGLGLFSLLTGAAAPSPVRAQAPDLYIMLTRRQGWRAC